MEPNKTEQTEIGQLILACVAQLEDDFHPEECYLNALDGQAYWVNSVDEYGLVVVPVGLGEEADVNTRGISFEEIEAADLRLLLAQIKEAVAALPATPEQHEYLFDVKLFASFRVKAATVEEARMLLIEQVECATVNAGSWPNGDPILGEASVDGEPDLVEIDGEATYD